MQLEQCSEQATYGMDRFYAELAVHDPQSGEAMIELLARLRSLDHPNRVWGLTSHTRLCLLAQDSSATPWYVIAYPVTRRDYTVEYLMPASLSPPWPNAYVRGEARSVDDAVNMIITAMDRSGGWRSAPAR